VRTGQVKIELRPISFIGPDSRRGRDAILAAGLQGKLFNVAELLFVNQGIENTGWLAQRTVRAVAVRVAGLDSVKLARDEKSSKVENQARKIDALARRDRVSAAPTVEIGKSGGVLRRVPLLASTDPKPVEEMIAAALR
jgi:protein-disulfide isomerase